MAFFKSFEGWEEISRGKKGKGKGLRSSWVAHFVAASGKPLTYNGLDSLNKIFSQVNGNKPPKAFNEKDHYLLALAMHQHPDHTLKEGKTIFSSFHGIKKDEDGNCLCAVFETAVAEEWMSEELVEQELNDPNAEYTQADIIVLKLARARFKYLQSVENAPV